LIAHHLGTCFAMYEGKDKQSTDHIV